jgi:hypothetical protein
MAPVRLPVVLIAALALAVLAGRADAAPTRFDTGFQDPLSFQERDPAHAYSVARAQHVRFIRVPVSWHDIAPSRPAHATDPGDPAYRWGGLDDRVAAIERNGLRPILALYHAPNWAKARHHGKRELTPRAGAYAAFARAAARHYDGKGGRRRVRYWQIWNEPNIWVYFSRRKGASRYRAILNAAYGPIHAAARGNVVIAGGLGPVGGRVSSAPLAFMRGVLCVAKGHRPRSACKSKASFDVWSHHPYTSGGPTHHAPNPDDVEIGELGRMHRVLRAARRLHHIRPNRMPGFWVTEFSWDTKPPDPGGVSLKLHARWAAEAFYRMWASGVSTMVWFQLRDDPEGQGWGYTWQAGLFRRTTTLYSHERVKPVARVIRFPFAAVPSGRKVVLWGRTPDSRRHKVTIQRKSGRRWKTVTKLRSNGAGVFSARRGGLRGKTMRAVVGGSSSLGFKAVHTKDKRVRPFGGPLNG